ncbi:hypothetical protein [Cohnella terricola]|uniref:Tetratricopeptide repeat protein n=1 Tax=Cohnella terricola TaxID=1289167 RepID=A0A559JEK6_9BACL|nr:hypothetical protein [Cohnella terricola]TVX98303.1 hypothetical protein FPZ45_16525 [Cohnella terricola]
MSGAEYGSFFPGTNGGERSEGAEQPRLLNDILDRLSIRNRLPPLTPEKAWHPRIDEEIAALSRAYWADGLPDGLSSLQAYQAALHLWNDSLEAAHELVQELDTPTGMLLHGIIHRREGDYDNAKYWFHRTGNHPAYHGLQARAAAFLRQHEGVRGPLEQALDNIVTQGSWNPYLFVNAVEIQENQVGEDNARYPLEYLQQLELEAVLRFLEGRIAVNPE